MASWNTYGMSSLNVIMSVYMVKLTCTRVVSYLLPAITTKSITHPNGLVQQFSGFVLLMKLQISWAVLLIWTKVGCFLLDSFICGQLAGGLGSGCSGMASAWRTWLSCTWLSPSSKLAWVCYHRKQSNRARECSVSWGLDPTLAQHHFCNILLPKQATCPNPDLRNEERPFILFGSICKVTLQRPRIQRTIK